MKNVRYTFDYNDSYEYELIATFPNNNEYIIIKI